jgi:hypothetical protein
MTGGDLNVQSQVRQMLGVERADGAPDFYDPEWLRANPRPDMPGMPNMVAGSASS